MSKKNINTPARADRRRFLKGSLALGAGAAVAPAAMLQSINKAHGATASGEPIPVGQASPQTGPAAPDGIEFRRGFEMACEEINQMGGVLGRPLEPHVEDTADMGDANVVQAIERLIDRRNCHAILNGYNFSSGESAQEVVADTGVIYIHYDALVAHNELVSSDPDRFWGSFMGCPPEVWYGSGFLDFIQGLENDGHYDRVNDKLAIITGTGVYSSTIAREIERDAGDYGWDISLFETVSEPISEWGSTLARLREDPPSVIAVTHYFPADLAHFMRQFARNPTNSLIYMQYGPSLAEFRNIAEEAANGVIYSTVVGAVPDDAIGSSFERRYKERYGEDATHTSGGQPYDATYIWAIAAALAGGPGEPYDEAQNRLVADRIRNMIHRGVNGTTRFIPDEQAAYHYPAQTPDPSLGMAHQFLQIQDYTRPPVHIAPWPYIKAEYQRPPWIES